MTVWHLTGHVWPLTCDENVKSMACVCVYVWESNVFGKLHFLVCAPTEKKKSRNKTLFHGFNPPMCEWERERETERPLSLRPQAHHATTQNIDPQRRSSPRCRHCITCTREHVSVQRCQLYCCVRHFQQISCVTKHH